MLKLPFTGRPLLVEYTGLDSPTIDALIGEGKFPYPKMIGGQPAWSVMEVERWFRTLREEVRGYVQSRDEDDIPIDDPFPPDPLPGDEFIWMSDKEIIWIYLREFVPQVQWSGSITPFIAKLLPVLPGPVWKHMTASTPRSDGGV